MAEPIDYAALVEAFRCAGLSLEELAGDGFAVALFGSRAAGCSRPRSDWDVLCVGPEPGKHVYRPGALDLIRISDEEARCPVWLHGDLAGHVLDYGVWLVGAPCWDKDDLSYTASVARKETRLASRVRAVSRVWDGLSRPYREKQILLLRRELQRLDLLELRRPVPPSARLEAAWTGIGGKGTRHQELLHRLGAPRDLIEATMPA